MAQAEHNVGLIVKAAAEVGSEIDAYKSSDQDEASRACLSVTRGSSLLSQHFLSDSNSVLSSFPLSHSHSLLRSWETCLNSS